MTMDYRYYRPVAPAAALSTYFTARLDLTWSDPVSPFPITGERWWGSCMIDTAAEFDEEAARLGIDPAGDIAVVTFELRKFLSTEGYYRAHIDLYGAVVDDLNATPDLTGLLVIGDVDVVIERPPGGSTLLDTSLADPTDGNHDHHLDPVLARGTVTDLVNLS
ncbi:hypothetical protein LO763_22390 [Glycomyces sp. A-F 0318]|uniref:hypothetical protein n=1 Tax=Glycomyces amatae TaxID=2881355 RepID=UPI001E5891A4|nr:hypothetical protein [Glycomyces amatae]MCD0446368.1 hypothetical protein [Glycomyces amatae]